MSKRKRGSLRRRHEPALISATAASSADKRATGPVARALLLTLLSALLLVAALALHLRGLRFPLVFDDLDFFIPDSLARWSQGPFAATRWLPYWSLASTYAAAGGDLLWLRLGNVLLHGANGIALFLLLRTLFLRFAGRGQALAWAFGGALLFVLHPAGIYATAYLVQRTTLAATFFSLLALWLLALWHQRRAWPWLVASTGCFFIAVTSKEHALPIIACGAWLLLWLDSPRPATLRSRALVLKSLALPAAAVISVAVCLYISGYVEFVGSLYEPIAQRAAESIPMENLYLRSVITQGFLFFKYLLVWLAPLPGPMSIDMREPVASSLLVFPETAGCALFVAFGAGAFWLLLRGGRAGLAGFALLCAWTMFLPEFWVVRVQEPFVLYRSYLWMFVLPAALPALLWRLPQGFSTALPIVAALLISPLAAARLDTFASVHSVWDDAIRANRDRPVYLANRAYNNRGVARLDMGRSEEARADFEKALGFSPNDLEALVNSGIAGTRLGRLAEAQMRFDRAIELKPDFAPAFAHKCVLRLRAKAIDLAAADCKRAVELEPRHENSRLNLGAALAMSQRPEEALQVFDALLALNPSRDEAQLNRAMVLNQLGRPEEARASLAAGCRHGSHAACEAMSGRDGRAGNR